MHCVSLFSRSRNLIPTAVAPVQWPPGNRFSNSARFSAYVVACSEDLLVQPQAMVSLATHLALTLPVGSRLFTAPRFGERLPDGVDVLPRQIESNKLCDVPIVFWNRSLDPFHGTPSFCYFAFCSFIFLFFL